MPALARSEMNVLGCTATGLLNPEIVQKLFKSEKPIKKHIYHIFQKMNVKNLVSNITKAKEKGNLYYPRNTPHIS